MQLEGEVGGQPTPAMASICRLVLLLRQLRRVPADPPTLQHIPTIPEVIQSAHMAWPEAADILITATIIANFLELHAKNSAAKETLTRENGQTRAGRVQHRAGGQAGLHMAEKNEVLWGETFLESSRNHGESHTNTQVGPG